MWLPIFDKFWSLYFFESYVCVSNVLEEKDYFLQFVYPADLSKVPFSEIFQRTLFCKNDRPRVVLCQSEP